MNKPADKFYEDDEEGNVTATKIMKSITSSFDITFPPQQQSKERPALDHSLDEPIRINDNRKSSKVLSSTTAVQPSSSFDCVGVCQNCFAHTPALKSSFMDEEERQFPSYKK